MQATKILVATDFSPASRLAFDVANHLASQTGATLIVLHVEPGQPSLGPAYFDIPDPGIAEIAKTLAALKPLSAGVPIEHRIQAGEPVAEILRVAADEAVDMIIVGSHGRKGTARLLMGSVATALLHKAPCPVLVCREANR